ncbi:MAG: transglutaminase-like domain-containing protein, partial [Candidatus Altiarchaeota archaeon]|nr:transglutaminase-like domain-containing protein [Candidatus Altiarchaeota archaeon]
MDSIDPCSRCDDGNPCTEDVCSNGVCTNKPLDGPVEGCYGSGGCIQYGCFSGECTPSRLKDCCGNGFCDFNEGYLTCPRDCQPTCFDGIKDQGEEGVDCGGPCKSCKSASLRYLERLGFVHSGYQNITLQYSSAMNAYNTDRNRDALKDMALSSYSDLDVLKGLILNYSAPRNMASLGVTLTQSIENYQSSLYHMALYMNTGKDSERILSNGLLEDSATKERQFVSAYNDMVSQVNVNLKQCRNYVFDAGEDAVDCGGVCDRDCTVVYNVTKYVTVKSSGGSVDLNLNVSSPAINYPPVQKILATYLDPKPDYVKTTEEGNIQYIYKMRLSGTTVRELKITHTLELNIVNPPVRADRDFFSLIYLLENEMSPLSDDICFKSDQLRWHSNGTAMTVSSIVEWMVKNLRYKINREELGAQYGFDNGYGACDEHADLFVSLSRCAHIPARRITGTSYNQTTLNGHAWAEYYDNGWIYLDPSLKDVNQIYAPDNRHITACVGEDAYHCGIYYTYSY